MYLLGILCLVAATVALPVLPDPPTLPDSTAAALQDSEIHTNIQNAVIDSAPAKIKENNDEIQKSIVKIDSVVIPPPPQLPPFDNSILKKQIANQKQKYEDLLKQKAENSKKGKVAIFLEKTIKNEVLPNPPTWPSSEAALRNSEIITNINAASDSASAADTKDHEEVKNSSVKVASAVIPPPPELPPFDFSILRKQIADQKRKSEYSAKQGADNIEKPVQVEVATNPVIVPGSLTAMQDTEDRENIFNVVSNDASVAAKKDDEEEKNNINKIVSVLIPPPPPELPPFDYSILRKQIADQKRKSEYSAKQGADNIGKPVQVEVAPKPVIVPGFVTAMQDTEDRENIFNVVSNDASVAAKKDDEEEKNNINKIVSVLIPPPPPELPPFDYSILRKQIADQKRKSEYSAKQGADNIVKPVQVEVATNPVIVPGSLTAMQDTEDRENIFNVVSNDASVAAKKDDEEEKNNINKIVSVLIPPPPPELPPFDYSILRKQKADQKQKSEYYAKQRSDKSKKEKEAVNQNLEKPVQIEVAPNPATLSGSVSALQDSGNRENILNVVSDGTSVAVKEAKNNMVKIASVVIPPPPELPPFDYSTLKRQEVEQKQNYENSAKQETKKKGVVIVEKPVEVQAEEEPKITAETKIIEDSKPKEELKKEPVKPSEDLPVIIQWTIPSAPFLSKLISNYPQLPSIGLEWPFQRSSIARRPRIIYPKFDTDGLIHTN